MTSDLVTFLRACLDEDERLSDGYDPGGTCEAPGAHLSHRRWVAEVAAKRRILDKHLGASTAVEVAQGTPLAGATRLNLRVWDEALLALASAYAGREGFREEWTL